MLSHDNSIEENLKATTRALSHDPLFLPSLPLSSISFLHLRGILNDAAFRHRFHDHGAYVDFLEKNTFSLELESFLDKVERLRWHLVGSAIYRGARESLDLVRQEKFSLPKCEIYECIEQFFKTEEIEYEDLYSAFEELKSNLANQGKFLEGARNLFGVLREKKDLHSLQKEKKTIPKKIKRKIKDTDKEEDENNLNEKEMPPSWMREGKKDTKSLGDDQNKGASLSSGEKDLVALENVMETSQENINAYTVFTKKYDEVIEATDLASQEERLSLRQALDLKGELFGKQINPLALKLYRFLKTQHPIQWRFNEEEGLLNGARLAQKIIDPTFAYYYKTLRVQREDSLDTSITLLVDNSGSMRGRPITLAALSSDLLARVLERCGVNLEILGFTTVAWKGGRSYQEWLISGQKPHPGRLNDVRHIIYKSFSTPWRKARLAMGVMLKEGILKENIDGEALLWAAQRLMLTSEKRKILIVISDGAPVDDMTLAENSPGYLENHLRAVVRVLGQHPTIQLFAIGIGHDVGRIYPDTVLIKSAETLGKTLFEELPRLLKGVKKIK